MFTCRQLLVSAIVPLCLAMSLHVTPVAAQTCLHDGNVNQDSMITPADALLAFQHFLGLVALEACQQDHADVNQDGSITPADALCIFRKFLGGCPRNPKQHNIL